MKAITSIILLLISFSLSGNPASIIEFDGSASAGTISVNLDLFESVYQYGSDFRPVSDGGDSKCKQDGVAPQVRVRGLDENNNNNVFIPDSESKNFVNSHLMKNYGWMLKIKKNEPGRIKKRGL